MNCPDERALKKANIDTLEMEFGVRVPELRLSQESRSRIDRYEMLLLDALVPRFRILQIISFTRIIRGHF